MNLATLRDLVASLADLPDDTQVVLPDTDGTFADIKALRPTEVLEFQGPRHRCPLFSRLHIRRPAEAFGLRTEAELKALVKPTTVVQVLC